MNGLPMRDDDLKVALSKIYSKFFCKWRSRGRNITDKDFDLIIAEMNFIASRYPQFPFVQDLLIVFLHEIEARVRGEYNGMSLTQWTLNDGFKTEKGVSHDNTRN